MAEKVQIIKGFQDIIPPASAAWIRIEDTARRVFEAAGFLEVRLPVLERTELFARGIGQGTDIVDKEMYTFADRKGRSLSLRPEGTASAVRAYLDSGKGKGEPARWWYRGPMFRYERPQKGRYRQFHQIGAEAIGYPGPGTDAEIIAMLDRLWRELELAGVSLEINSLGCPECRPAYRAALVGYLRGASSRLCKDCLDRLDRNPLRVLDCKEPGCKEAVAGAPVTLDYLCPACADHFAGLKRDLDLYEVSYSVNPRIVRGLDYYTRTVFEYLATTGLGSQNAVGAGGRYDGLVQEFGGPPTPAIGFAVGIERLALLLPAAEAPAPRYFLVAVGEEAQAIAKRLLGRLRASGIGAEMITDDPGRSFKSQMKAAAKSGAKSVVIIGEDEAKGGFYTVKDLTDGGQTRVRADEFEAGA